MNNIINLNLKDHLIDSAKHQRQNIAGDCKIDKLGTSLTIPVSGQEKLGVKAGSKKYVVLAKVADVVYIAADKIPGNVVRYELSKPSTTTNSAIIRNTGLVKQLALENGATYDFESIGFDKSLNTQVFQLKLVSHGKHEAEDTVTDNRKNES